MSFDGALDELMFDTVTIEAFSGYTGATQVPDYSDAVTYKAQVLPYSKQMTDENGKEFVSQARVIIPERVAVDSRSRVTLPAGFTPQTPPVRIVRPVKGLGLDHTEIILGGGGR